MDVFEIIEVASHPAFVADEDDRIVALNAAAEELLGTSPEEIVGRAFHEVTDPRDVFGNRLSAHGRSLQEMVRRGEPIQAYDLDVRQASGRFVRAGVSLMVAFGPEPGKYHLVYHVIPRRRRRRSDQVIDQMLKNPSCLPQEAPESLRRCDNGKRPKLTRRENQILARLAAGESTHEISRLLEISPNTLRSHTQNILKKLGVRSRVEAVSLALRQNLV